MSKRRAGNELTRDNWDEEEEKEESGRFQVADNSILKNRIMKKGKRMLQRDETGEIKPLFSGFSGFNNITSNSNSKQAFSFLSKHNETPSESGNHASASTINSLTTSSSLQISDINSSKSSGPKIIDSIKVMKLNEAFIKFITDAVQKNPYCVLTPTLKDYEKQISKFVSVPSCKTNMNSLMASSKESPQVSSFENMVTNIKDSNEMKNNSVKVQKTSSDFTNPLSNTSNKELLFNFSKNSPVTDTNNSKNKTDGETNKDGKAEIKDNNPESVSKSFSLESNMTSSVSSGFKFPDLKFNQQPLSTILTTNSSDKFIFGDSKTSPLNKLPEGKLNTFNFGASGSSFSFQPLQQQSDSKPFFSFGSKPPVTPISDQSKNTETEKPKNEDEDEDQPPVVNFTPVKETDAIFESKSKLYCLKEGKYEEHGIGQLYIKSVDDKKVQLIMRNDSALGTIMVNTLLNNTVNFSKRNTKNVQLTCVLDPTKCVKPQTVLFKFKDSEITDAFEKELAKLKK